MIPIYCHRCQSIFDSPIVNIWDVSSNRIVHHDVAASFHKAVAFGCVICTHLLHIVSLLLETAISEENSNVFSSWHMMPLSTDSYEINFQFGSLDPIKFYLSTPEDVERMIGKRLTSNNTGSPECWHQALEWYHYCLDNHIRCRRPHASFRYPTRILDVGNGDAEFVRLCLPAQENLSSSQYVTLSHCWGETPLTKLTSVTLDSFQQGLSIAELPRTFAEAIEITRRLGIRYLWIDSLCIIQDSLQDWQRESSLMETVYHNSHFNVAATASSNSGGGIFRSRSCFASVVVKVRPRWLPHGPTECLLISADLWHSEMNAAPLNRRAWVLQERVLSPRVLHFGASQLFWECHELDACEAYPTGIPKFMSGMYTHLKAIDPVLDGKKLSSFPDGSCHGSGAYVLWRRIVQIYTACQLSFAEDKLVAVEGLAKRFRIIFEDEYIAGLWRKPLHDQLLWQRIRGAKLVRTKKYRAPTWSWASVDGPILPRGGEMSDSSVEIIEAHVNALDNGQVTGGWIFLQGRLCELSLLELLEPTKSKLTPTWDFETPTMTEGVFFLPIYDFNHMFFQGLLLRAEPGGERGSYERLGQVSLYSSCGVPDVAQKLVASHDNPALFCEGIEKPGILRLV